MSIKVGVHVKCVPEVQGISGSGIVIIGTDPAEISHIGNYHQESSLRRIELVTIIQALIEVGRVNNSNDPTIFYLQNPYYSTFFSSPRIHRFADLKYKDREEYFDLYQDIYYLVYRKATYKIYWEYSPLEWVYKQAYNLALKNRVQGITKYGENRKTFKLG